MRRAISSKPASIDVGGDGMTEAGARNWEEVTFTSRDGLTLYARHYAPQAPFGRPVLCLPGLTRNSRDFHELASFLSSHPSRPREVWCPDYRGRGQSDRDANWRNYSPLIELLDILDLMTITGLTQAAVVGTSRGGIIALLMSVIRPATIAALVLNDIGPVIETAGLARIMGYAGKIPVPADWDEATELVRAMNQRFFTNLTDDDWRKLARQLFADAGGRPASSYDGKIANALSEIDITQKLPEMWPQFQALTGIPLLVLRGENSDLLSAKTVEEMAERHPQLTAVTIHAQGHAPLLNDRFSMGVIADFLRGTDPSAIAAGMEGGQRQQLPSAGPSA
jgi:pimeloyl-ACP methyl ester carboxylesterase